MIFRATAQWFIGVDRNGLRERTLEAIRTPGPLAPRAGARGGSRRWSASGPTGASAGSGPGACRSPPSSTSRTGEPAPDRRLRPPLPRPLRRGGGRRLVHEGRSPSWSRRISTRLRHPIEHLSKGTDILDVWFESGSSHRSVLREPSYDSRPVPRVHVPRRLRPAPRLVPVVDPDRRRHDRPGPVRDGPDARLRRRRQGREAVEVAGTTPSAPSRRPRSTGPTSSG